MRNPSPGSLRLPFRRLAVLASLLPWVASAQVAATPPPPPPPPAAYPVPVPQAPGKYELSAFGGWATSSDIDTTGGTLKIGDVESWGAALGFRTPYGGNSLVVLKWIYYDPKVSYSYLGDSTSFHVPTNYFLLGGEKGIRRGRVEPFFGGSLGAVMYSPGSFKIAGTNYSPGTTWRMAFGISGGLKVFATPKIAIRLGAEMIAPIYFESAGVYVGTGGGGLGVSGGIPTVTGNFTIGVTFVP